MSATALAISAVERTPIPDVLTRGGVAFLVGRARVTLGKEAASDAAFAADMARYPIATDTADANAQHYEVPTDFFRLCLGPRLKYSSCLYDAGANDLAAAEVMALTETCAHADLRDGQRVLELGCGWGSLSLWMAERYPASRITSVSNSASQRAFIEAEAASRGLTNLTVITADMNVFQPEGRFDRMVSVEMFEHMSNWRALLERVKGWLEPDGRAFLHVFSHRDHAYRFDADDPDDWIAKYFFTGGIMPSHDLIHAFPDLFEVEADWRWSGAHYQRTANDWLANFDRHRDQIDRILRPVYGADTEVWKRRWRLFFLATAGLFGDRGGETWGVSHYRLKPA
jgi:cyclopropane-fatty-acyl-phospholipid synthase